MSENKVIIKWQQVGEMSVYILTHIGGFGLSGWLGVQVRMLRLVFEGSRFRTSPGTGQLSTYWGGGSSGILQLLMWCRMPKSGDLSLN